MLPARTEILEPPDRRHPMRTRSLPHRVVEQLASLSGSPGRGARPQTFRLPQHLVPSDDERHALRRYAKAVDEMLAMTPEHRGEYEAMTLAAITGLFLAKPAQATNDLGAGAKVDSYMEALDDVAFWAVEAAIRKWHRGECGTRQDGELRDYRWAPDTVSLRNLARIEEATLRRRADKMLMVAAAEAEAEYSEEHEGRMGAAWRGLVKAFGGKTLRKETTIEELVSLGNAPSQIAHHQEDDKMQRAERLKADLEERKRRRLEQQP
jgi:hypothetical protein